MILEYKFEYLSNSAYYETYLENILNKKAVDFKILREKENIYLYIKDEETKLLSVSDELSNELPMSIFLKNFTLEVVSQIPISNYTYTPVNNRFSYCTKCKAITLDNESADFYNPFLGCDICGTTCDVKDIRFLERGKEIFYKDFKQLFELLASKIDKNKKIKIKTFRGTYIFSKDIDIDSSNKLLCCNLENLNKIVVGSKQKELLLSSVEKPSIDFNINEVYRKINKIKAEKVNIVYTYDLILVLLSKELEKYGINFLSIKKDGVFDCEFTFVNLDNKDLSTPKIVFNENKTLFLENQNYNEKLNKIYKSFQQKAKAQFMVLAEENKLHKKAILNLYSSLKYDDNICLYSRDIGGFLDILNYKLPNSISDIFEEISKDEKGKKLLDNYKDKFPTDYENALDFDISKLKSSSINSLWEIASIILGCENILENANKALLPKGPRIDYKIKKSERIFNKEFEISKFIQSGISFLLAGVDKRILALGYVESYAEFLSSIVDEVNENFEIDGVSLCGDIIGDELFYKLINKSISKNFQLFYNKEFPIQL